VVLNASPSRCACYLGLGSLHRNSLREEECTRFVCSFIWNFLFLVAAVLGLLDAFRTRGRRSSHLTLLNPYMLSVGASLLLYSLCLFHCSSMFKIASVMALRKNHIVFVEKFIWISFLFLLEVIPLSFTLIFRPFPQALASRLSTTVEYQPSGVNRTASWVEFTTQRILHRRESECLDGYMDYYIKIRSVCAWIRANRSRF